MSNSEIYQRLAATLDSPFRKLDFMSFAAFSLPWILVLAPYVPPRSRNAGYLAWGVWLANIAWAAFVYLAHKRQPPATEFKQMSPQEQSRWHRQNTIWFRLWKSGFLLLVSFSCFMVAWRCLRFSWPGGLSGWLAIGLYVLTFAGAVRLRHHLYRISIEGWPDTWWGRLAVGLAIVGPSTGAALGSLIGRTGARLLPESFVFILAGLLGLLLAYAIVPQVVYDAALAIIHIRAGEST